MSKAATGCAMFLLAVALVLSPATLRADEMDELIDSLKPSPVNYAVWAESLLKAGQDIVGKPKVQARLYEKAYEYGLKQSKGYPAAIKAAQAMLEARPGEKSGWHQKLLAASKLAWQRAPRSTKKEAGKEYIDQLIAVADDLAAAGDPSEAVKLYTNASRMAKSYAPDRRKEIARKLQAIEEQKKLQQKVERCKRLLAADAQNAATRETLIRLYVLELDQPAEARKVLTAGVSEKWRTYVPLAAKKLEEVAKEACLELGNWYRQLPAGDARTSPRSKRVALTRAATYYRRFLDLAERNDLRRLAATTHLRRVTDDLSALPGSGAYEPWRHQPLKPGILGRYFAQGGVKPLHTRIDERIFFDWGFGPPAPGVPTEHFEIEWSGVLNVPASGTYQFHFQADDGGALWIDKDPVAATLDWRTTALSKGIQLTKGRHLIRVIHWDKDRESGAKLFWSKVPGFAKTPIPHEAFGHVASRDAVGTKVNASYKGRTLSVRPGLQATIFEDANLRVPARKVVHRHVLFDWGKGGPKAVKNAEVFSIRWEGYLRVLAEGSYHFSFLADDKAGLWLDGEVVVPMGWGGPEGTVRLSKGLHKLRIDYADTRGLARCIFSWRGEGSAVTCPVPPRALFH